MTNQDIHIPICMHYYLYFFCKTTTLDDKYIINTKITISCVMAISFTYWYHLIGII